MNYLLEKQPNRPLYLQVYTLCRNDIVAGVLPHGAKMPSKRFLAEELGVSVVTVEHAYAMLCDEGYIAARERSGYYVCTDGAALPSAPPAKPFAAPPHRPHPHDPSDFPFSAFAKTIRRVLSEYGEQIVVKAPSKGCVELRAAIGAYLARVRGMHVSPEQIVIGSGAEYLYSLLVQLLGREQVFGIETPSYPPIERVYRAHGVRCERLPLSADGIESEALRKTAATVLHVTPFHSFPSGVSASAAKRAEYVRWADERGGCIIEDDFDSEFSVFAKPADTIFSIAPAGMVVYLNTFSKSLSSAMRIGYMVLPESLLARYEETLGFYSCTVPVFDQYILAEFINSGELERHINRLRRRYRRAAE